MLSYIRGLFESTPSGTVMLVLLSTIGVMVVLTVFLVVVALAFRLGNRRKQVRWEGLEKKWEPLLLEVLAGDRPARDLRLCVRKGEELYFVDFLYRYGRRLRGREADVLTQLARPYLRPIVQGVRRGDAERRARAVQTLGVLDFGPNAHTIRQALDDPSPLVSMIAARALARPDQARHVGLVLSCIHRFESWSPRFLSSLLASMGSDAAPKLRATLADTSIPTAQRSVAADALRRLADPDAATAAVEVLYEDVDRDLHSAVLRLLGKVGQPEHVPAIRRLSQTEDPVVRAQAIRSLGRLGSYLDVPSLRGAVDDDSPWVAIHGMRGLREVGRSDLLSEISISTHARAEFARQVLSEAV